MSESFSVAIFSEAGAPVLVPPILDVRPATWSAVERGGMWDAQIDVSGPLTELAGLTAWLGNRVEIRNRNGAPVWWGDIATVEIVAEGVRRGVSLDSLTNRVQVRYAQPQVGGGAASADTDWADNAYSQAHYGVREGRISPAREMSAAEATAYRATALNTLSGPRYTLAPEDGEAGAVLFCTGYWQRNRRKYYSRVDGLIEHTATGEAFPLGLGFTSSSVAFVARTKQMHSIAGYFANFAPGLRVTVGGAAQAGNNGDRLLDGSNDERPAASYTSTAVTFSPNDDMADANGGLGILAQNDVFTVAGTNDNNGTHLVDKAGAAAIEVSAGYHGSLVVSESAGDTAVFTRGNFAQVTAALTNELAGNSVTVTAWGQKHYQSFAHIGTESWTAAAVEVRLRRVGGPTDSITVDLVADSSSAPGTVFESSTVTADNIPVEMGWVRFALAGTTSLSTGNTYGIVVKRGGSNDPANYYEIELDDKAGYAGGVQRQWNGAAWKTPDPTASMVFRVLGAVDTAQQASYALRSLGWAAAVDSPDSGVVSNQYRDGETRADEEIETLLDVGTSQGFRLLSRVQRNQTVQVYAQPDRSAARWVLRGRSLYDLHGQPAEDGYLPAGEWVHLGDTDALGPWAQLSPVFVERAQYDAGAGWRIEPVGTGAQYDMGVTQG